MEVIRVAPGSHGGGNGPFWTAMQLGLFEQVGLRVEVRRAADLGGARNVAWALAQGDLDFATFGASTLVRANLDGAGLVAIMGIANRCVFQVMAAPDVASVADLRGRRVAGNAASTADVLWQWLLPRHGLRPGHDVELVQLPPGLDQMDALRRGVVDAITLSPAGSTFLRKEGFRELVDFSTQDFDFALGCVATARRTVDERPKMTLAYARASVAAMRRYMQDRDLGLRVLRSYTGYDDPEILGHTYDVFCRAFSPWPYPAAAGFETVVRTVAELDPRARDLTAAACIDRRPLDWLRPAEAAAVTSPAGA